MNVQWKITLFLASLIAVAVSACDGSSGTVVTPPPTGGISRLGIAVGPVSNFSSVVVNGVAYNTDNAVFTVNDAPAAQSDIFVGDIVTVAGTIDANGTSGTADTVIYEDSVTGPIESIDVVASQVVVLGQTVLVRPETSFDDSFIPASIDGLSVGQNIEVTGQIDANGNIVATRIGLEPAGVQLEVHGNVSSHDSGTMRFNINNLVVDYSNAILDDFPGGQIRDGDFVEAKGAALGAAGELLATEVQLETLLPGVNDGDRIELEGFITRFASALDFDVSGQSVITTASTVFEGGTANDLGLNIKVEVEGDFDSNNGVLLAVKIDIRPSKAVRAEALVDSVDAANDSLVLLGITVTVNALTRFEDKSNSNVDPLTLADVNAGDYVEIRGDEFPAGSGMIRTTIFERDDPEAEATLQGFAEAISDPSFTILGVTIETNGATVFRDENDSAIMAADFFDQVAVNSLVKAKGMEVSDTTVMATEVEFELEF